MKEVPKSINEVLSNLGTLFFYFFIQYHCFSKHHSLILLCLVLSQAYFFFINFLWNAGGIYWNHKFGPWKGFSGHWIDLCIQKWILNNNKSCKTDHARQLLLGFLCLDSSTVPLPHALLKNALAKSDMYNIYTF